MIRGSGRTVAPNAFSRLEHQLAYSTGNKSFPSAVNQAEESWAGSVFGRKSSGIFPGLNREGNNTVEVQISHLTRASLAGGSGWSLRNNSCIIAAQSGAAH